MINNYLAQNDLEYQQAGIAIISSVLRFNTSTPKFIALTGGTSPALIYQGLPSLDFDWHQSHFFWSDERIVPLDSPDSNYQQSQNQFLEKINVPEFNINPVQTSLSPDLAALHYGQEIQSKVPDQIFDLVILGLGPDGHIASLFPTHQSLEESKALVLPIYDSPKPPPERVSFSLPLIRKARNILLLIKGENRVALLQNYLTQNQPTRQKPFSLILDVPGQIHLLMYPSKE